MDTMTSQCDLAAIAGSDGNIDSLNECFRMLSVEKILKWAWEVFGPKVVASSSFQTQSVPLLHIISRVCPDMPIIFLDTGFHFPETLAFRDDLQSRYGLNVVVVHPAVDKSRFLERYGEDIYHNDPELCCYINKVEPMQRVLPKMRAWISGVRKDQTPYRSTFNVLEPQPSGLIKIHPVINWTERDIREYMKKHTLPSHPLLSKGYRSIGCEPCTRPISLNDHLRAGRWAFTNKTECGLHIIEKRSFPIIKKFVLSKEEAIPMKNVVIRDRGIGEGHPPYFVAELGICHEGSVEIAKQLAQAAKQAGADCIKTETFQRERIVFDPTMTTTYSRRGEHFTESLLDHMAEYQLSFEDHAEIKRYSDELGLPFMSTAHDFEAVDFLADIGAEAIKISSADIIHYPLIRYAAKTGLVLFIDTGAAYQYEIEKALRVAEDAGAKGIVFNHHPGGHPAPPEIYNLRIIPRLRSILEVPVGTADHYDGYEMVYTAVAVGADVIEKPISRDRFIKKPEHIWAVSIADLPEVISNMHAVYNALGIPERKEITLSKNRVSLVAKRNLEKGNEISFDNVLFGRPPKGISVEHWDLVEGRTLKRAKSQGEFITWEDV